MAIILELKKKINYHKIDQFFIFRYISLFLILFSFSYSLSYALDLNTRPWFEYNSISFFGQYDVLFGFENENKKILAYSKVPKGELIELDRYHWNNKLAFVMPLSQLRWKEFSLYSESSENNYHIVVVPEEYLTSDTFEKLQEFDGLIKDEVTTAIALNFLNNDEAIAKAINYLKTSRNDQYKCWPKECEIGTTIKVLYFLKKAHYDNLKIFSDAMVWLKTQLKDSKYTLQVLVNPKKENALCNVSFGNYHEEIAVNESYRFNITYSNEELRIKCDNDVYVVIYDDEDYKSFSGKDIIFDPELNCFGSKNRIDDCDVEVNAMAKELGFDVDFKPKIKDDDLVGKKIVSLDSYKDTAIYYYLVNPDSDMLKFLLYYQNNDGSWSENAVTTLYVLNALKKAIELSPNSYEIKESYFEGLVYLINHYDELDEDNFLIRYWRWLLLHSKKPPLKLYNYYLLKIENSKLIMVKSLVNTPVSLMISSQKNYIESIRMNFTSVANITLRPKLNLKSGDYWDILIFNASFVNSSDYRIIKLPIEIIKKPELRLESIEVDESKKLLKLKFKKSNDEVRCKIDYNDSFFVIQNNVMFDKSDVTIKYDFKSKPERIETHNFTIGLNCSISNTYFVFRKNISIKVVPSQLFEFLQKNLTISKSGKGEAFVKVRNLLNQKIEAKLDVKDPSFVFIKDYFVEFKPKEIKKIKIKYSIPDIKNFTYKTHLSLQVGYVKQYFPIYIDLSKKSINFVGLIIKLLVLVLLIYFFRKPLSIPLKFIIRTLPILSKILPPAIVEWAWQGKIKNPEALKEVVLKKEKDVIEEIKDIIRVMHSIGKPEYKIKNYLKTKGFSKEEINAAYELFRQEMKEETKEEKK